MATPEEQFSVKVYSDVNKALASLQKAQAQCEKAGRCGISTLDIENGIKELQDFLTQFKAEYFPNRK